MTRQPQATARLDAFYTDGSCRLLKDAVEAAVECQLEVDWLFYDLEYSGVPFLGMTPRDICSASADRGGFLIRKDLIHNFSQSANQITDCKIILQRVLSTSSPCAAHEDIEIEIFDSTFWYIKNSCQCFVQALARQGPPPVWIP